ncbi:MAG: hypothetical protein KBT39_07605 [Bacteroidales bacterium]|nr:hypothetical protein [Bacteroidales bacterium]
MKRTFFILILLAMACGKSFSQSLVIGKVQDAFLKTPLPEAQVELYAVSRVVQENGGTTYSCTLIKTVTPTKMTNDYGTVTKAQFEFEMEKKTCDYKIRASQEGYEDAWMDIHIDGNVTNAELLDKPLELRRIREKMLKDVNVTATKIKMYHKGDTIVYNADAFDLPEGSMLEDLIREMPGVMMNDYGEIFVNGRKVDELLLGSHTFMHGNRKVLLENLPYFTVKDVKVYEKQSDKSRALGYDVDPRSYVMDVNMKKEYQLGFIGNVEAAGGTEGRWLGRGFVLGFGDRWRLTLFGNANNVNESRHIEGTNHWTPASMPTSMMTKKSTAAEFYYHAKENAVTNSTNIDFSSNDETQEMSRRYEQFLQGRTPLTLTTSSNKSNFKQMKISNEFGLNKHVYLRWNTEFDYTTRNASSASSLEQWDDSLLTAAQHTIGKSGVKKSSVLHSYLSAAFNVNKEKQLYSNILASFLNERRELWSADRFETQNYLTPSSQNSHNTSDKFILSTQGSARGFIALPVFQKKVNFGIGDAIGFANNHIRDNLYHPDTLLLPSQLNMLTAITDPRNSYDSRSSYVENNVELSLYKYVPNGLVKSRIWNIKLNLPVRREKLDYQRGVIDTTTTRTTIFLNTEAEYRLLRKEGNHDATFNVRHYRSAAGMLDQLAWHDDSQPLIVRMGNPDLKGNVTSTASINYYNKFMHGHQQNFHLGTSFNYYHRSVAQSVQYAPTTGVHTYKPMNVSGAYLLNANFDFSRTLDSKHYWSIQTNADASLHHSVDHAMLAGETESHLNTVNTLALHNNAYIQYDHNKLNLRATGDIRWRHSEGKMLDFDVLNAFDFQYGLSGRYTIPGINMTVSADATMYSRRGYGSSDLNTDDFVLNASLSQPFLKGKLIARIEAFDLLHQLPNTQYVVNAQGRTITWYRSLPHYVMLHLVYHWNKNPKKK